MTGQQVRLMMTSSGFNALLPFIAFALGVAGRVLIPYLIKWLDSGEPFNPRYMASQILAALVAVVPLILVSDEITRIGAMALLAAFAYGWFASDLGREIQKGGQAARKAAAE